MTKENSWEKEQMKPQTLAGVHIHAHTSIFYQNKNDLQETKAYVTISLFVIEKLYIKYRNFKDGLLKKIVCPFYVLIDAMNSS